MEIQPKFAEPSAEYLRKLREEIDYDTHNAMVEETMRAFPLGKAARVPMTLGVNPRILLLDPRYNKNRITFQDYFSDPRLMFEVVCEFSHFSNMYIPFFHRMGEDAPLSVYPDFQNFAESAWFGAEIDFENGDVPSVKPLLQDDTKNMLFDRGIPEPISGIMERNVDYYEKFTRWAKTDTLCGSSVGEVYPAGLYTDGPFTLACELMGTTQFCCQIYEDPDFARRLLDFLTTATVKRIQKLRSVFDMPPKSESIFFADDSIALLSCETYRDLVLPFHRRYCQELLVEGGTVSVHLCGDATRHFKTMQDALNVTVFDTGFPVKHGELCASLRKGTVIQGGPSVPFLELNDTAAIEAEVKRILDEVRPVSNTFILREGNNVPPRMPLEKLLAMYRAVVQYGVRARKEK